jgi:hypothetical protein
MADGSLSKAELNGEVQQPAKVKPIIQLLKWQETAFRSVSAARARGIVAGRARKQQTRAFVAEALPLQHVHGASLICTANNPKSDIARTFVRILEPAFGHARDSAAK